MHVYSKARGFFDHVRVTSEPTKPCKYLENCRPPVRALPRIITTICWHKVPAAGSHKCNPIRTLNPSDLTQSQHTCTYCLPHVHVQCVVAID